MKCHYLVLSLLLIFGCSSIPLDSQHNRQVEENIVLLQSGKTDDFMQAVEAIEKVGPDSIPILVRHLSTVSPKVRCDIIIILGMLHNEKAIGALQEIAEQDNSVHLTAENYGSCGRETQIILARRAIATICIPDYDNVFGPGILLDSSADPDFKEVIEREDRIRNWYLGWRKATSKPTTTNRGNP